MLKVIIIFIATPYILGDNISCFPNCIAIIADSYNPKFFNVNSSNIIELAADFIIRTNPINGDPMSEVTIQIKSTLPNIPISVYNDNFKKVNFTIIAQRYRNSSNDTNIIIKKFFEFGQKYTIKIGYKKIRLNMIDYYDKISNNCSPADIVFGSAHYASLWKSNFNMISIDNNKKMINISFSGAPSQYCFEEYEIELENLNNSKVESKFFSRNMLIEKNGYFFGNVSFKHLFSDNVYVSRIKASKYRGSDKICLCIQRDWNCGCMVEISNQIYLESSILLEKDENSKNIVFWHILLLFVISTFFLMSLIISCILFSHITKTYFTSQIIAKSTPLLSHSSESSWIYQNTRSFNDKNVMQNILIIHNNIEYAETLAYELKEYNCNILLDCWDSKKINKNKNFWISNCLKIADKILLIPDKKEINENNVYKTFLSCINITDPRVIIVVFQNNIFNEISLCTEKLYILPRDKELLLVNALLLKKRRCSLDSSLFQDTLFDDNFYEDKNNEEKKNEGNSKTTSLSSYTENCDELFTNDIFRDTSLDRIMEICEETV
uniref:SEFIR domain-containing protein n=1 Tax=Strongyloides papillosus TaxID=174720 RepID=A0A0N5BNC6_STREA